MSYYPSDIDRKLEILYELYESIKRLERYIENYTTIIREQQKELEKEVDSLKEIIKVTEEKLEDLEEQINETRKEVNSLKEKIEVTREELEERITNTKVELNRRIENAEKTLNDHLVMQDEILEMNSNALLNSITLQLLYGILRRANSKEHIIIGQLDNEPLFILEEADQIQVVLLTRKGGGEKIKELEKLLQNYTGKKVMTDILTMKTTERGIVPLTKIVSGTT